MIKPKDDPALYFNKKYRIPSTRLKDWNYSWPGYYFVTACVKDRRCVLSKVCGETTRKSEQDEIAQRCWDDLPRHYYNCRLDEFIVMPNHIHGIIEIAYPDSDPWSLTVETGFKPVSTVERAEGKRYSLFEIMRGFLTFSSRQINVVQRTVGQPFWQPRFRDHIIRSERALNAIRHYIRYNALKWQRDEYNPEDQPRKCTNAL